MSEDVLLGFADGRIKSENIPTLTHNSNYLGHGPSWDSSKAALQVPHPLCEKCAESNLEVALHFVMQIYCPIDDEFHRTLYIYLCSQCNCWSVYRQLQRYEEEPAETTATQENFFDEADGLEAWGDEGDDDPWTTTDVNNNADPWFAQKDDDAMRSASNSSLEQSTKDMETSMTTIMETSTTELEESSSSKKHSRSDVDHAKVRYFIDKEAVNSEALYRPFFGYHIDVECEGEVYGYGKLCLDDDEDGESYAGSLQSRTGSSLSSSVISAVSTQASEMDMLTLNLNKLSTEYEARESQAASNYDQITSGGVEKYERLAPTHGDVHIFRFGEYLKKFPTQLLRYSCTRSIGHAIPFNKNAALLLDHCNQQPQKCRHCGGPTKFEMQLLPALQDSLLENDQQDTPGTYLKNPIPDIGSIYIFTCERNCWNEAVVQDEFNIRSEVAPLVITDSLR